MKYVEKITVTTTSSARDEYGQAIESSSGAFTTGAYIRQQGFTESARAGKETNSITGNFELHRTPFTAAINITDKIQTSDGKTWDITNVDTISLKHLQVVKIIAVNRG